MASSSKSRTFYDTLEESDKGVSFYMMENGEKKKMTNSDFTLKFLSERISARVDNFNNNNFPCKTFIDESINFVIRHVLKKIDFSILFLLFQKTSAKKGIVTHESLNKDINDLCQLITKFKTKNDFERKNKNIVKIIENSWFFDHFIFPPLIKNILDHLEVLNLLFRELKIIYDYVEIEGWSCMTVDERLERFYVFKNSAIIYHSKFSCFVDSFKSWITNEIIYRHFGKRERFKINYDLVYTELYNCFVKCFCCGSSSKLSQFIEKEESFSFEVNSKQYNTERPKFYNHEVKYHFIGKKYLNARQSILNDFLSIFTDFMSILYRKKNDDDTIDPSFYITNSSNRGNERIDNHTDKLVDLSVFNQMNLVKDRVFMQMFPFFESWDNEKNPYPDLQKKKYNRI